MTKSNWFDKLIGYQFCYNNREFYLVDTFDLENDNGKVKCKGYGIKWCDTEDYEECNYKEFKNYISQTNYPR